MKKGMGFLAALLLLAALAAGLFLPEAAIRAQELQAERVEVVTMENVELDTAATLRYSEKIELAGAGACVYLMDVAEGTHLTETEAVDVGLSFLHALSQDAAAPDMAAAKAVLETYSNGQCLLLWETRLTWSGGMELVLTLDDETGRLLRFQISSYAADAADVPFPVLWPEIDRAGDSVIAQIRIAEDIVSALTAMPGIEDCQWAVAADTVRLTLEDRQIDLHMWIEPSAGIINFNGQ